MNYEQLTRRDFLKIARDSAVAAAGISVLELINMYGQPLLNPNSNVVNPGQTSKPSETAQPVTAEQSSLPTPDVTPLPSAEPTLKPTVPPTSEATPMQELAKIKPGEIIYTADTHKKIICLTVDDGFNKANMKKIMDAANKRGVKMSFLPIGSVIAADPGLYREIIDSGHEIYNHTQHHYDLATLSAQKIKDEILWARDALWKAAGREIPQNLLRPPGGAFNKRTVQVAAQLGYGILMWDVTSAGTSRYATVDSIEKRVAGGLHNGAIVLQHPTPFDTAAFPIILDNVLTRGYNVVPVARGLK